MGDFEYEKQNCKTVISNVYGSFISSKHSGDELCGKYWKRDNRI